MAPAVLRGLALSVVEVRRGGDDGVFDWLTEIVFGGGLQFLKHDGRDLGRTVYLVLDLDVGVSVAGLDHFIRKHRSGAFDLGRVEAPADEPLDTVNSVLRVR